MQLLSTSVSTAGPSTVAVHVPLISTCSTAPGDPRTGAQVMYSPLSPWGEAPEGGPA